jgi:hypothetical protein
MGSNRSVLCLLTALMICTIVAGCGGAGSALPGEAAVHSLAFEELAALYRSRLKNNLPPPRTVKDFSTKTKGLSPVLKSVSSGNIVVIWGAGMSDDSASASRVLAYEKQTPEKSGIVLMQNGTFKKMSAEEFKDAPRAAESQ